MACCASCANCRNFIPTTAIAIVGNKLRLTIPAGTFTNHQRVCIRFSQPIPTLPAAPIPVMIQSGTSTFNIILKSGNFLYTDQLEKFCCGVVVPNQILSLRYASDSQQFVYDGKRCLCRTKFQFPSTTTVSAVAEPAEGE